MNKQIIITSIAVNIDTTPVITFEANISCFFTGNVCVRYDSSLYTFLINLTHDLINVFIKLLTIILIAVPNAICDTISKTNEFSIVLKALPITENVIANI